MHTRTHTHTRTRLFSLGPPMAHRSPGAARHRPPRHSPTRRAADHRRDHRLRRRHREQPREGASQHAHFQVRVGDAQSAELLVVVATCTHSRARPAQPAHALHSRRPRISNAHGRQTAVAAAAPRAHPPRTTPRLPAAWLSCHTGASRDTASERETLVERRVKTCENCCVQVSKRAYLPKTF